MLTTYVVLGIVCFVLSFILYRILTRPKYFVVPSLATACELNYYRQLSKSLPNDYVIVPKVRVADVIDAKVLVGKNYMALRKFFGMHFDFVVVKRVDLRILGAIEIDDLSHDRRDRRKRDIQLNSLAKRSGLKLLRVKSAKNYDVKSHINELVHSHLSNSSKSL